MVVDEQAIQTQIGFDATFTGAERRDVTPVPLPLDHQKIILRRAALELERGDVVNLGVGMGSQLPGVIAEEGALDALTFSVEHGALGGVRRWACRGRPAPSAHTATRRPSSTRAT